MGKIKFGRAFGLSILGVLSLMSLFAGGAQAKEFQILLKPALLATFVGTQEGTGSLLVPGRNLTLNCTAGDVETGSEIISPTQALAKIQFLGCTALSHSTGAELPCTVDNPLATAVALPVLHNGERFILFEPDPGTAEGAKGNFTTVLLLGELCPLPEVNPVKGTTAALIEPLTNDTVKPLILFSPAISTLLGDALTYGGFASTITAKAELELTGAHVNEPFGIG